MLVGCSDRPREARTCCTPHGGVAAVDNRPDPDSDSSSGTSENWTPVGIRRTRPTGSPACGIPTCLGCWKLEQRVDICLYQKPSCDRISCRKLTCWKLFFQHDCHLRGKWWCSLPRNAEIEGTGPNRMPSRMKRLGSGYLLI